MERGIHSIAMLSTLMTLDHGQHDQEVIIVRAEDDGPYPDLTVDCEGAGYTRFTRKSRKAIQPAKPAPIPDNPSRQVRRALERAARKGGAQ